MIICIFSGEVRSNHKLLLETRMDVLVCSPMFEKPHSLWFLFPVKDCHVGDENLHMHTQTQVFIPDYFQVGVLSYVEDSLFLIYCNRRATAQSGDTSQSVRVCLFYCLHVSVTVKPCPCSLFLPVSVFFVSTPPVCLFSTVGESLPISTPAS